MTTCVYAEPYYDEAGKYHDNDPNKTATTYTCSNGHRWVARTDASGNVVSEGEIK